MNTSVHFEITQIAPCGINCGTCRAHLRERCIRLKNIDKRYQARYRTSLIQNLRTLSVTGFEAYLLQEKVKWTCKNCSAVLSVHYTSCLRCGKEY